MAGYDVMPTNNTRTKHVLSKQSILIFNMAMTMALLEFTVNVRRTGRCWFNPGLSAKVTVLCKFHGNIS
jgi:hypothetical protein